MHFWPRCRAGLRAPGRKNHRSGSAGLLPCAGTGWATSLALGSGLETQDTAHSTGTAN